MKNIKWMTVAALATGMVFQLGGCGMWGQIGLAIVGLLATQSLGT